MSAYLTAVLADAPLYYWRLADPPGGSIASVGSNLQRLYLNTGNPQLGFTGPVSDGGSCLFTGKDAFISPLQLTRVPPYTLEGWFFISAAPASDAYVTSLANAKLGVQGSTAKELMTVTSFAYAPGQVVASAGWHHLVFTVSSTTIEMFYDGVSVGSTAHATASQTDYAWVGATGNAVGSTTATNFMQGWGSEVAYYASVLSHARILAHFNAADQVGLVPQNQVVGVFNPVTGSTTYNTDVLQSILAAVQKTFPTT